MKFLIDTNTISYYLRGVPSVVERWQATPPKDMATSALVAYELHYGLARLPAGSGAIRRQHVARLLGFMSVLPFDGAYAEHAALVRASLESKGMGIGPADTLIAATALRYRLTLVSRNVREFGRVPGLNVLNWFD